MQAPIANRRWTNDAKKFHSHGRSGTRMAGRSESSGGHGTGWAMAGHPNYAVPNMDFKVGEAPAGDHWRPLSRTGK